MDALFEILLELVFEGSHALGTDRRVAWPLRVAAALVFGLLALGMAAVLLLCTVLLFRARQPLFGTFLLALLGYWVWHIGRDVFRFFR